MMRIDDDGLVLSVPPPHSTTQYAVPIGMILTSFGRPRYEAQEEAQYTADELQLIVNRLRTLEGEADANRRNR